MAPAASSSRVDRAAPTVGGARSRAAGAIIGCGPVGCGPVGGGTAAAVCVTGVPVGADAVGAGPVGDAGNVPVERSGPVDAAVLAEAVAEADGVAAEAVGAWGDGTGWAV